MQHKLVSNNEFLDDIVVIASMQSASDALLEHFELPVNNKRVDLPCYRQYVLEQMSDIGGGVITIIPI